MPFQGVDQNMEGWLQDGCYPKGSLVFGGEGYDPVKLTGSLKHPRLLLQCA